MRSGSKPKRTDIQALRAIAVLAVVIYHLWPHRLTGGFMGVDVFFVISGYLMTLTLTRHIEPVVAAKRKLRMTGSYLVEFYARRIKRLVPAASVTLVSILGIAWITGNFSIIEATSQQVTASALFAQNLFLASQSVDYLAAATPPTAVQHFWSLSLEEQFYLMWPLLLLVISFLTINITVLYKKTKIPGALIAILLLTAASFAYGYFLTKSNPSAAYFITFARVWELLFGGILVFLPALRNYDLKLLLPWLGSAMIGYAMFKWDGMHFPGWHALVPVVGTALILYASTSRSESRFSFTRLTKYRPIQWIGDISYSLYLWHWPLIVLVPLLTMHNIDGEHGFYMKLGILVMSFILAWLSYRFVELPTQKIQLRKRWIYVLFVIVVGVVAAAGVTLSHQAKNNASNQLQSLRSFAESDQSTCLGARSLANEAVCGTGFDKRDPRFEQMTSADMFTNIISTGKDCTIFHPTPGTTPNPTNLCEVGDITSNTRITIWGDSHANQWINALDVVGRKNHVKFTILSSGQCAGMDAQAPYCNDRLTFIRESRILDNSNAILLAIWYRYGPEHPVQPTQDALDILYKLTATPIYLLQDIPPAGQQGGPDCIIRGLACKNNITSAITPMYGAYKKAIDDRKITLDHIIPTQDMFCDKNQCYSFIGGLPVYQSNALKDDAAAPEGNAHITATYSLTLAPLLETKLRAYNLLP